jgi:hypothetical protein
MQFEFINSGQHSWATFDHASLIFQRISNFIQSKNYGNKYFEAAYGALISQLRISHWVNFKEDVHIGTNWTGKESFINSSGCENSGFRENYFGLII